MKLSLVRLLLSAGILSLLLIAFKVSVLGAFVPVLYLPNLFIVLVILITLEHNNWIGVVGIFVTGLFADISSGLLIGPWAAGFLLVYVVLSALSDRVFVESFFSRIITCALCTVLASVSFFALSLQVLPPFDEVVRVVVFQTLSTAFLGPIFFPLFKRVIGRAPAPRNEYPSILYTKR